MPSAKTIAKRLAERRTWSVTWINPQGKWVQAEYNQCVAAAKVDKRKVRIPSKRVREAARAHKAAQADERLASEENGDE